MADITDLIQASIAENADAITYSANGTETDGFKIWVGTEAQYEAIATKDAKTLYIQT